MSSETRLTLDDHKKARDEVAFLMGTLSKTILDVVGAGTGIVGRRAGVEASKKLPLFFESTDRQSIIEGIQEHLKGGFGITSQISDGVTELSFDKCALRYICAIEDIPVGGSLCALFHDYMNGMIDELGGIKSRVKIVDSGETCKVQHTIVA